MYIIETDIQKILISTFVVVERLCGLSTQYALHRSCMNCLLKSRLTTHNGATNRSTKWGNKHKHKHKMGPQNTGVMLQSTTKDGVFRIKGRPFQEEFKTICFDKRDITPKGI